MTKRHLSLMEAGSNASAFSRVQPEDLAPPPNTASFSSEGTFTPDSQEDELLRMADPMSVISVGALQQIHDGNQPDEPVLQCVQIKPMASQNGRERYRVVMNDTRNFIQGMMGTGE